MKHVNDNSPTKAYEPLASRMRPRSIEEFVGQEHLLGRDRPLRLAISQRILHSMILWGPPGVGKTTLAQLMSTEAFARLIRLSAISSGVKDIRQAVEDAKASQQSTILFIDEIHRFNKTQQDVLLPFMEDGTFILIGATTENPSFELNNALLSRARVYVLKSLSEDALLQVLDNALMDKTRGLGNLPIDFPEELRLILIRAADGDARQVLNLLEIIADMLPIKDKTQENRVVVTKELLSQVIQMNLRRFDKQGEAFYDQISALHKAVRGSAPDAALYWLCRMLDGGCDPYYILRRTIRMAAEDIGLADPRALQLALDAYQAYERLGTPEGELMLAEVIVYLACLPKSNAVYTAFNAAMCDAKQYGSLEVPLHLRNAPTKLMKDLHYGKEYRYAHDEPDAYAKGENYFPEELASRTYYHPTPRGLEAKIAERLGFLRELDKKNKK